MRCANISVERMAAGGTVLPIRPSVVRRHRSPLRWAGSAMRHFIIICLLALAIAGCTHARRSGGERAMQIWHSPEATLEQRAHAASVLIAVGSSSSEIIGVLGTNGSLANFHGP